jgi:hypothetical protein
MIGRLRLDLVRASVIEVQSNGVASSLMPLQLVDVELFVCAGVSRR